MIGESKYIPTSAQQEQKQSQPNKELIQFKIKTRYGGLIVSLQHVGLKEVEGLLGGEMAVNPWAVMSAERHMYGWTGK